MSFAHESTPQVRSFEGAQDGLDLPAASKRRRLTSSPGNNARMAANFLCVDDEDDGCPTPPRESTSPDPVDVSVLAREEHIERWIKANVPSAHVPPPHVTEQEHDASARASNMTQAVERRSEPKARDEDRRGSTRSLAGDDEISHSGSSTSSTSSGTASSFNPDAVGPSLPRVAPSGSPAKRFRLVPNRSAPLQYDVVLIKFTGCDSALRCFMTTGSSSAEVVASLKKFHELNGGSVPQVVRRKLLKFKDRYETLRSELSTAGRTSPSADWQEKDLLILEDCEQRYENKVLKLLHDEVYMRIHRSSRDAEQDPPTPPRKPATRNVADHATSTVKPNSSSLQPRQEQLVTLEQQLKEQSRQINLLHAQGQGQAKLLAAQAELLEQQSRQTELQLARARLQDKKLDSQMEMLQSIQQQLQSFKAASRKHK